MVRPCENNAHYYTVTIAAVVTDGVTAMKGGSVTGGQAVTTQYQNNNCD